MNFDPEFSNFFMNFFNFFVFYRSFHIMVVPIAQEGEFCMQSESSKWRALSTNQSIQLFSNIYAKFPAIVWFCYKQSFKIMHLEIKPDLSHCIKLCTSF